MGVFSTPTLHDLRESAAVLLSTQSTQPSEKDSNIAANSTGLTYEHLVITDILKMHSENPGATFQAASQFNCLEFGAPHVTPEYGVSSYAYDETQGPACALACAAGTIFRNYFARVNVNTRVNENNYDDSIAEKETTGQKEILGQSENSQLNTLDKLEELLHNKQHKYWAIRNGYSFSDVDSLTRLNLILQREWPEESSSRRDELRASIKVGVQEGVGVTFSRRFTPFAPEAPEVLVNQVYCSALSCGYSGVDNEHWAPLATLILEASYEATLLAALCSHIRTGSRNHDDDLSAPDTQKMPQTQKMSSDAEAEENNINTDKNKKHPHKVFLTFLGGGVFRNETTWIAHAIGRALAVVAHQCADSSRSSSESEPEPKVQLHVVICHFRRLNTDMCAMIDQVYLQELGKLQGQ